VLRMVGLAQEADELAPQLPDPVDVDRESDLFDRYGIDLDMLIERMGGTPG
jgi:hypothetical protein